MHVVAHAKGVPDFVQDEAVQGLAHKFRMLFISEVVGTHCSSGQEAVAAHDCAGVAAAHLLSKDFARGAVLQFCVELGVLFVHGLFDHAGF